jgi:hypothetical protein
VYFDCSKSAVLFNGQFEVSFGAISKRGFCHPLAEPQDCPVSQSLPEHYATSVEPCTCTVIHLKQLPALPHTNLASNSNDAASDAYRPKSTREKFTTYLKCGTLQYCWMSMMKVIVGVVALIIIDVEAGSCVS